MPAFDPRVIDGDVHVSPRYLAGTTGIAEPALSPLRDLGWDVRDDNLGNLYVSSPHRSIRLGYLPEGPNDGLWRISAYTDPYGPPTWGMILSGGTPTEFARAVTTALAAACAQDPEALAAPAAPGPDPFQAAAPMLDRGWTLHRAGKTVAVRSPDGLARLDFTLGRLDPDADLTIREARWDLWAGTSAYRPYWYATASTHTPVALLWALTDCVSDPGPLLRWRKCVPSYITGARVTPVVPIPTPLDVRRATARRPAATSASSIPRWTTTSRPAVHR
jgi:hypothetical protein